MPTKFVLLTTGRSGSSWLMEMLNSHPTIGGYGELFSPRHSTRFPPTRAALYRDPGGVPFFGAYADDYAPRVRALAMPLLGTRYMNRLYAPRQGLEAIGFRLIYGHLRPRWGGGTPVGAWLLPYMAAKRVRVVHLMRRNSLDYVVSRAVAASRGVLHARPGDELAPAKVSVDTGTLVSQLDWQQTKERRVERAISLLGLPCLVVDYEQLLADTGAEYRQVVEFLGAHPVQHEPQWRMRKVIETRREETIENYESVKRTLQGTKYASFL